MNKSEPTMAIPQSLGQTIVNILQAIEHAPGIKVGDILKVCMAMQEYSIQADEASESPAMPKAHKEAMEAAVSKGNGASDGC